MSSKVVGPSSVVPTATRQAKQKTPLGSINRQDVNVNCVGPTLACTEVKNPGKGMHTVPFTPSAPISQTDLSDHVKLEEENMAVSREVVATEDTVMSVVTPEGAKTTYDQTPATANLDGVVSPPLTPPRVASVLSKENVENPAFSPPKNVHTVTTTTTNRNRILSLDRAGDDKQDSEGNRSSVSNTQSNSSNSNDDEDSSQADSSDGESSYFAKHLPSPKSGRRFSYSSNHSAPARTSNSSTNSNSFYKAAKNRASDASLSFSDESDDDDLPGAESPEPVAQLPSQAPEMQVDCLTRIHSYNSLVSSDDSHNNPSAGVLSPESSLSRDSSGSVNAELSTVRASSNNKHAKNGSGRHSPMPGHHSIAGVYYGAPPAILPGYNAAAPGMTGMLHPQPQTMNPEQFAHWASAQQYQHQHRKVGGSKSSKSSDGAVPFVYSDDETDDMAFMHQLAGNGQAPDGLFNTFANGGGSGGGGGGGGNTGGGRHNGSSNRGGSSRGGSNPSGNGYQESGGQGSLGHPGGSDLAKKGNGGGGDEDENGPSGYDSDDDADFTVYPARWIMLFYMSLLNLLSDWTCYSVAPIAILTQESFGDIDPESLVVIFLGANAVASACEPIILARLGLKKTVLLGSFLLMIGSMIKCGGLPPIFQAELHTGEDEWRLTLGFFLVGLSQPLYQCTPALLSASWFPEAERTMATGVALNANQLGIGAAFVFGTLLVAESDDIPSYFGLLSMISTLTFIGTLFQFDDAPPTPPSSSAKVMKGDLVVPDVGSVIQSVRKMSASVANDVGNARRRAAAAAPSPASWGQTEDARGDPLYQPSPMMPGGVRPPNHEGSHEGDESSLYDNAAGFPGDQSDYPPMYPAMPYGTYPPPPPNPYFDPRMQHQQYYQQAQFYPPPPHPYYYGYQNAPPAGMYPPLQAYPGYGYYPGDLDEGAEPVVTISDHHLDIDIRDDQVLLSLRACFARPGFVHSLVTFTISGIVINTLSTYMDYLVTLNGAGRKYVGIVGGLFQGIIMLSSLVIGKFTDKSRAYYSVIIGMLVLGAFGLAQCGVSLDGDRGADLRVALLVVAALVGPLQPVSTEMGVEIVYPLSENTVLVIQQLFSNLLSALFIPFFKSLRDIGVNRGGATRPQYTFSFYLLICLHAIATIFFASFNGRYLRYETELQREAKREQKRLAKDEAQTAFIPVQGGFQNYNSTGDEERQPLASQVL